MAKYEAMILLNDGRQHKIYQEAENIEEAKLILEKLYNQDIYLKRVFDNYVPMNSASRSFNNLRSNNNISIQPDVRMSIAILFIFIAVPLIAPFLIVSAWALERLSLMKLHPLFIIITIIAANLILLFSLWIIIYLMNSILMNSVGMVIYGTFGFWLVMGGINADAIWSSAAAVPTGILGWFVFNTIKEFVDMRSRMFLLQQEA